MAAGLLEEDSIIVVLYQFLHDYDFFAIQKNKNEASIRHHECNCTTKLYKESNRYMINVLSEESGPDMFLSNNNYTVCQFFEDFNNNCEALNMGV